MSSALAEDLGKRMLDETDPAISEKTRRFQTAIARYDGSPRYRAFGVAVSLVVVGCQAGLVFKALANPPEWAFASALAIAAFVATDFVNGMVHLWMDHNDRYGGSAGPLVAQFHLHHRTPRYRRRPLAAVYFLESGSKIWLALVLAGAMLLAPFLPALALWFLACFGVLSSVAEVSHYLCHTSGSRWVTRLGRLRILLPRDHLRIHHRNDNRGYCFLNGMCDPVVDWIAHRFYTGYKHGTDRHFALYRPPLETGSGKER